MNSEEMLALMHPRLDAEQIRVVEGFGERQRVEAGRELFRAGDEAHDLYIVLSGVVGIIGRVDDEDELIIHHTAGEIVGEFDLITRQRTSFGGRMLLTGEVIAVSPDAMRRIIATQPALGDLIVGTFVARRERLLVRATRPLQVVGPRHAAGALALSEYLTLNRLAHRWVDTVAELSGSLDIDELGDDQLPAVVIGSTVLPNATPGAVAELLGLTISSIDSRSFDVVIVGAGPAGLAAAVYAASEGLTTLTVESVAPGGQAGTSSRIENYLGFPNGVSGLELTTLATTQALKFGARFSTPCEVTTVVERDGGLVVCLADGNEIEARAVVAASGARYRRLAVERLADFEGTSVFYAATEVEARLVEGAPAVVVGGGNSAGQAAVFLSNVCSPVTMVLRGDDLRASMSSYLAERIEANPLIDVRLGTQVTELHGHETLEAVTVTDAAGSERVAAGALFSFIGAVPSGEWLAGLVETDEHGFVVTDRSLEVDDLDPTWDEFDRLPLPFETSRVGVFAVGDLRSASTKRIASAVGEGSGVVRSVHTRLASMATRPTE